MPPKSESEPVTSVTGYVENPDHVPSPTDVVGTLDTSGTGGAAHNSIDAVSPVFAIAKEQDLTTALRALDDDDDEVATNLVVTPVALMPGDNPAVEAKARLEIGLEEARQAREDTLDPSKVPGAEDGWPNEQKDFKPEEAEQQRRREMSGDDGANIPGSSTANVDLTGTLDTTGIGTGVADASTISAASQVAKAEGTEKKKPGDQPNLDAIQHGADAPGIDADADRGSGVDGGGTDGSGDKSGPDSVADAKDAGDDGGSGSSADVSGTADTSGTGGDEHAQPAKKAPAKKAAAKKAAAKPKS